MRASTAAGINNSLLPRDCSCEGFPGGHLLVVPSGKRPLFLVFVGCGSAVWERGLFSLAFVWKCRKRLRGSAIRGDLYLAFIWDFPVVPSGEEASFSGVC